MLLLSFGLFEGQLDTEIVTIQGIEQFLRGSETVRRLSKPELQAKNFFQSSFVQLCSKFVVL